MKSIIFNSEIKNDHLIKIAVHHTYGLISAISQRSILLLNHDMNIVGQYFDSDPSEKYYSLCFIDLKYNWNIQHIISDQVHENETLTKPFVAVGVNSVLIKIVDIETGKFAQILRGHTGIITVLKSIDHYIISGSGDNTIRIWDCHTETCIGIMGGMFGHKGTILSIDIHYSQKKIISAGIDCTIKEWNIEPFYHSDNEDNYLQSPLYTYEELYNSPIVQAKYYGDIIISMSDYVMIAVLSNNLYNTIHSNLPQFINNQDILSIDKPFILGHIQLKTPCLSFSIVQNTFIGLNTNGEIFYFDLSSGWSQNTLLINYLKLIHFLDFVYDNNFIYIVHGDGISRENISPDIIK